MINPAMQKIRNEYCDWMIFHFCHGKPGLGVIIRKAEFDIEKKEINLDIRLPGVVQEIQITPTFQTKEEK